MTIEQKIIQRLEANHIEYEEFFHDGATSSLGASKTRGSSLSEGAKSLFLKDKSDYRIFTMRADLEADNKKMRSILGSSKLRFATKEELFDLCGVVKGALAPLVKEIYPYDHYLDQSILKNEYIVFNAGILSHSIRIRLNDYLQLVDPKICDFTKEVGIE
jgi:prolyl-tRNA editing enzyme YbaK/EbsC (Cys-tRNA(Pro) deacylase)